MEKMNIPICRAKKTNSNEWIIGNYCINYKHSDVGTTSIQKLNENSMSAIDITTLAIHFPNMIDKNGKKIFASLSEDGVGGDIIKTKIKPYNNFQDIIDGEVVCTMKHDGLTVTILSDVSCYNVPNIEALIRVGNELIEVIGIYKG